MRVTQGEKRLRLDGGWSCAIDEAGAFAAPAAIPTATQWRRARVPGTLAGALLEAGASYDDLPPLDALDVWYKTAFVAEAPGELLLHGLAPLAEVFVDGDLVLRSDNMFLAHSVEVGAGRHDLHIRFRSVEREIATKSGRARWRPRMIAPAGLRHIRTSALGHLPGFAPPTPPIGPWREVEFVAHDALRVERVAIRPSLTNGVASLHVALDLAPTQDDVRLICGGREASFQRVSATRVEAELRLPDCRPWTPHTHGEPHFYAVEAQIGGRRIDLGRTGFRDIRVDRGADGRDFRLTVNDIPVFCRGACWTTADVVSPRGTREECAPLLTAMRDAGMNMVRVPGVTLYESDAFYALCDELGLMVWQDFAFANFDYPIQDAAFRTSVEREAEQFLTRTQGSPSLAVLCGGSEVYQQASMLGLAESKWRSPLFDEILPRITRAHRPDAIYVEGSPSGGALPFHADSGVSHYYGVGAYRRDLADARRANVRFASECLGFANIPETDSLTRDFGPAPLSSPLYASRVPRDMGALQTFGEVTEHYMQHLYGVDPSALRESDPAHYLDVARAAVAETMEATIGEWRRGGSTTHGAIVWFLKDMQAGPGWGVLDARGAPKSAYFALKRAFRPLSLVLTDEGVNGLFVHLRNDTPLRVEGEISLACYRDGRVKVMQASRRVAVEPHGVTTLRDTDFWGGFFDTALAYNFGPPSHDATVATFVAANGSAPLDAFHFPLGRSAAKARLGLRVAIETDGDGVLLALTSDALAQSVKIEDESFRPADNWLHLPPGATRRVRLGAGAPHGLVSALNGETARY
jgi:beta-mannosidase